MVMMMALQKEIVELRAKNAKMKYKLKNGDEEDPPRPSKT